MADIQVKGLQDLHKLLQLLPSKVEANVLRGALGAGAKVIRDEARRLAPVASPNARNRRLYGGYAGALRDSIRHGASIDKAAGKAYGYVRAGSRTGGKKGKGADAWYARFVEYGTRPHLITLRGSGKQARRANRVSRRKGSLMIGQNFVGPSVMHPGAQPKPFLRPALDLRARDAVVAAAVYMRKRLATKHGLEQAAEVELEVA